MTKRTLGHMLYDRLKKNNDKPVSVQELGEAGLSNYMSELLQCAATHAKKWPGKDFYIEIPSKAEKAFLNHAFRFYFVGRQTCPPPFFDQTVWQYSYEADALNYLWTIPDKKTCEYLRKNALTVPDEQKQLLGFVLNYYDGNLHKKMLLLNGEMDEISSLIILKA